MTMKRRSVKLKWLCFETHKKGNTRLQQKVDFCLITDKHWNMLKKLTQRYSYTHRWEVRAESCKENKKALLPQMNLIRRGKKQKASLSGIFPTHAEADESATFVRLPWWCYWLLEYHVPWRRVVWHVETDDLPLVGAGVWTRQSNPGCQSLPDDDQLTNAQW